MSAITTDKARYEIGRGSWTVSIRQGKEVIAKTFGETEAIAQSRAEAIVSAWRTK